MRSSPSLHSHFFSSLKQVEKRLKLDNHPSPPSPLSSPPPPLPPAESNNNSTESLSSPIYLNFDQPITTTNTSSTTHQESEPPQEFLSNSPDFPLTHQDPPPQSTNSRNPQTNSEEIELLMQLLGLSDSEDEEEQRVGSDDGFYAKIVGVKGPKCEKEVKRLEGWIKRFIKNERIEPLRLAHLLLGKAAFVQGDSDGFEGLEFPSTIDEFLCKDPPAD